VEEDSLWIVEPIPSTEDSTVQRSLWIGKVLTVITVVALAVENLQMTADSPPLDTAFSQEAAICDLRTSFVA